MSKQRSTQEVLDDPEDNIARDDVDDMVVVSNWVLVPGQDGMRQMVALLQSPLPECAFTSALRPVSSEIGVLKRTGPFPARSVPHGLHCSVFRDGRIVASAIDDTLIPGGG
jgi:hypothetical protein